MGEGFVFIMLLKKYFRGNFTLMFQCDFLIFNKALHNAFFNRRLNAQGENYEG